MEILRTPDKRFENLQDYDFAPHYTTIKDEDGTDIRIHHVDEGDPDAEPILLMHGNPTWSYLHRHMIRPLAKTGHRVISVDLVGLGRSDKPAKKEDYSLARHHDWMSKWLLANELSNITWFGQDWGGSIGLYLLAKHPERFTRAIAANTGLPIGQGASEFFDMWLSMMKDATEFPWDQVFKPAFMQLPSEEVLRGYMAPFPGKEYQAGICSFPSLIPVLPDNPGVPLNKAAWEKLQSFEQPFLTLFGGQDPVTKGHEKILIKHIPGAMGQAHKVYENASHFIQEDAPDFLVGEISAFLDAS
jgi:haloalkane dehalogenase